MFACVPRLARAGFSDEENDTRFLTFSEAATLFECVLKFVYKLGVARESGCPYVVEEPFKRNRRFLANDIDKSV